MPIWNNLDYKSTYKYFCKKLKFKYYLIQRPDFELFFLSKEIVDLLVFQKH